MQRKDAFIHVFQTLHSYYFYDVNTNSIVKIDEELFHKLKQDTNMEDDSRIEKLRRRGFLKAIDNELSICHPLTDKVESCINNNLSLLILQVTQNCNLRCKYCVYSGSYMNRVHNNKRMDFETARKAIDFYYEHSKNTDTSSISFYGGEPLLEIELIKKVISYCEKKFKGKSLNFNMTTNATLLTKPMMELLVEKKVNLTISLDGPEEVHNRGRVFADNQSGTFQKIMQNLKEFQELYPEYVDTISFNAVLDHDNNFQSSNDFFSYEFFRKATVTYTTVSNRDVVEEKDIQEEFSINYKYELFKKFLSCIGRIEPDKVSKLMDTHINKIKTSIHDHARIPFINNGKTHPSGPCVPGMNRLFVTVDGELFPCERVNETNQAFHIGNLESGFDIGKVKELLNVGKSTEKNCRLCWAMGYCDSCAADLSDGESLSIEKRLERCASVRFSTEELMKEYCLLRENGYCFD